MTFDLPTFRALFPQFDAVEDSTVTAIAEQAKCYASTACGDKGKCADQLLMLMVAHLLAMRALIAGGGGKAVASASEGSVNVTMVQPANPDARSQWLNITPYGQQYAALETKCIKGRAAAGLYIGGYPEPSGFRKIGGVF